MVMFDSIEELFQNWRNFNEYTKALVTLATAIGTILIVFYSIKFVWVTIKDFRLYFLNQICFKTDFVTRYGKWACVSGSTDGIGLAMAKVLANRGHSIIVIGRNEEKLTGVKSSLEEEPNVGEVVTVKIDLSDSSLQNYERIRGQIDPDNRDIGILINCAGTFRNYYGRFNNFEMEDLRVITNVNILATTYLTRMIMPGMLYRGKGLVVNVSSILGSVPGPYMGIYGATKAFVNSFSNGLQAEYSSHPIDIINLNTGPVYTKLFQGGVNMKSNLFVPTSDEYAKSALNAIAARFNNIAGIYIHEIAFRMFHFIDSLGLLPLSMKISVQLFARDFNLSPVMKRRKISDIPLNPSS